MELAHVRAVVSTFALATAVFVIGSLLNVTRWSKFVGGDFWFPAPVTFCCVSHFAHHSESMSTLALKLAGADTLFFSFGDRGAKTVTISALGSNHTFRFADRLPPQVSVRAAIALKLALLVVLFVDVIVGNRSSLLVAFPTF